MEERAAFGASGINDGVMQTLSAPATHGKWKMGRRQHDCIFTALALVSARELLPRQGNRVVKSKNLLQQPKLTQAGGNARNEGAEPGQFLNLH